MHRILRGVLLLSVLTVLAMALMPSPPSVLTLGDPAKHAAGMGLLTLLFALAYPDRSPVRVFLVVASGSFALEILQGALPFGRDFEMRDWLAGLAGSIISVSAVGLVRFAQALKRANSA